MAILAVVLKGYSLVLYNAPCAFLRLERLTSNLEVIQGKADLDGSMPRARLNTSLSQSPMLIMAQFTLPPRSIPALAMWSSTYYKCLQRAQISL